MASKYWIMFTERNSEDEVFIDETPKIIEDNDWDFSIGEYVSDKIPIIKCGDFDEGIMKDNIVAHGLNGLLFNYKVKDVLDELDVNNMQYFDVELVDNSDVITLGYMIGNIVGHYDCIDYEKSSLILNSSGRIRGIDSLSFKEIDDEIPSIFRISTFLPLIVVSDKVKNNLEMNKVTGVVFYNPEDFYL